MGSGFRLRSPEVLGFGSGAEAMKKRKAVSKVAKGKMAKSVVFRGSKDRCRRVGQQQRTGSTILAVLVHRYLSDASRGSRAVSASLISNASLTAGEDLGRPAEEPADEEQAGQDRQQEGAC